jgi:hypothetical protein
MTRPWLIGLAVYVVGYFISGRILTNYFRHLPESYDGYDYPGRDLATGAVLAGLWPVMAVTLAIGVPFYWLITKLWLPKQ